MAYPSTLELVKNNYRKDKYKSQSEFIERTIQYYVGHVTADDDTFYLPNAFLSNMKSIVAESDNKHSKMLFKLSVEIAIMQNLVAARIILIHYCWNACAVNVWQSRTN